MPRPPTVSRRRVLVGAAALAALGVTAAGCAGTPSPPPDLNDLTTALDRARSDSTLARDVAATVGGRLADVLTDIAAQRAAHAEALSDEIVRMTGQAAPTTSAVATPSTTSASVPAPRADDVIGALRASADSATHAAGALSGYRAGLLASIAASCTAAYAVALAGTGDPQ